MEISKYDWKKYREKISGWQEAYMEKLCMEYVAILNNSGSNASERFWTVEQRIKRDKRCGGVLIEMRRSHAIFDIAQLVADDVITFEDLSEFSAELQDAIKWILH